jgi:aminomethyltransferase
MIWVDMKNISEDYSLLAIQGQKQLKRCKPCLLLIAAIKYYHFEVADFAGIVCDYLCNGLHRFREVLKFIVKNTEREQILE